MGKGPGRKSQIFKNILFLALGILAAFLLARSGAVTALLAGTRERAILGSFIGGLFFTSIFTVAPATVLLGELARTNSLLILALVGGVGALIGDLILYRFLKSHLGDEVNIIIDNAKSGGLRRIFHLRIVRWVLAFIGALIVASPLPDEIGLALMGISKLRLKALVPISFVFNTLGIFIVGLVARSLI